MKPHSKIWLTVLCVSAMLLGGCVQNKSVPGYARSGDIVVLGLGGIHRNAQSAPILSVDDLLITITDANSQTYNLSGSTMFKAYPAYDSALNAAVIDGLLNPMAIELYDGAWNVTVPLTYDGTHDTTPLPLAIGGATINISSAKLTDTKLLTEGSLAAIPIEIVAGTSAYDVDYNRQFGMYQQSFNVFDISPNDLTGISSVAGAYFVITYSDDSLFTNGLLPTVVPSNHNPYVQLSYNVVENGDGTGQVRVVLLNPAGFKSSASATNKSSRLADLSVRMQYFPAAATKEQIESSVSVDLVESYYIDMDGSVISGLEPSMMHLTDIQ
ncbi:hypothetical protein [Oceanicoccus sp. KOV_DT_Chl]|uniref:hypothetical protein n=1 Tax=Oceanicoccus sp. KOV_DT_Chl TaxID=1904639 RepID=UPI0011AED601|nr:hypothetical protein [Oceanicoccus sp. KOV_DT_Chl]